MIGGAIMTGHPTVARQLIALFGPNQNLAAQATWWIDPINGSNRNNGKTQGTALQTRSEFARRMFGVTLTQAVTVNVTSSLNAGDDQEVFVFGNQANNWTLNWVGVPTVIGGLALTVTAYTAQNGAASQPALMTIAGIPVSWTASGFVGKVIERVDGTMKAIVQADLGAKQARLSPPVTNLAASGNFTNGDSVKVYSLPNMRSPNITSFQTFKYLDGTRWQLTEGRADFTSCSGPVLGFGGVLNIINHVAPERFTETGPCITVSNTYVGIYGGYNPVVLAGASNASVFASCAMCLLQPENGAVLNTVGSPGPDVELYSGAAAPAAPINFDTHSGGEVNFSGHVYGVSSSTTNLIRAQGVKSKVTFFNVPNVTVAVNWFCDLSNITDTTANLNLYQLGDNNDNVVTGPAGRVMDVDRELIVTSARKIITETVPVANIVGQLATVSGTVHYQAVGLKAGDVITNLTLTIQVAAVAITLSKVGLYDKAGNRLAVSADQGTSWQTTGVKTIPLTAPFTVTKTDVYYVAEIAIATTTQPTFARGCNGLNLLAASINGGIIPWTSQLAQADLPNPATFAAALTGTIVVWVALS